MPRGKESMNMEGDKCRGRREPSESQRVGLRLGLTFFRWILEPKVRLKEVTLASWGRSCRRWDRPLRFAGSPE